MRDRGDEQPAMSAAEFDRFADEYESLHAHNVRLSGETTDYFAAYKIADLRYELDRQAIDPATILDLGAGVGNSVPFFRQQFPKSQLVCLDVSARSLAIARSRYPAMASYLQFDGSQFPVADSSIDVGFAACVFHHVQPSARAGLLEEFRRVIRPGGLLCLFEHNPLNPLTLAAVNSCPFDEDAELIRAGAMRDLFGNAGFQAVVCRYRLFFPRLLAPLRKMDRLLSGVPLGAQYYVLGKIPALSRDAPENTSKHISLQRF